MNKLLKVLLVLALVSTFGAPVIAAENEDSEGMIYGFLNGRMYKSHVDRNTMHSMMSHFRPLPNGSMIYSSGGRYYIARDRRMSNGEMMSTQILGAFPGCRAPGGNC
jgi:hypothetical protein